jgi:putative redox protein
MITVKTIYKGELRVHSEHIASGNILFTDAPIDNKGKGETFSPTDLVATALGSCMLTIIGIAAQTHGFNIDGTHLEITKIMESNPRRIGEVIVSFYFPKNNYSLKEQIFIKAAAETCPVAKSLHPDLKQTLFFNF